MSWNSRVVMMIDRLLVRCFTWCYGVRNDRLRAIAFRIVIWATMPLGFIAWLIADEEAIANMKRGAELSAGLTPERAYEKIMSDGVMRAEQAARISCPCDGCVARRRELGEEI